MTYISLWQKEELYSFIQEVEASDFWDDFGPEEYTEKLDMVGLDYKAYEDPDTMRGDFIEKASELLQRELVAC